MAEGTQRRLAAIVSADVVGYSRLMGADEAGTLATMKAHRRELWIPTIERFGGRVVGGAGDSILVEYASAVAAVESAIAVQRAMVDRNADLPDERRMLLRIGINIGEVIVDDDDIYGDGVNVAARVQEIAAPGGIAISDIVRGQVQDKLDVAFVDDGDHAVKNIAEPVRVWRWPADQRPRLAGSAEAKPLALPDKPSIAVLPFDNISGDPEQEYFSDGMTEDIITALSRLRWLFVIARNSTFSYKDTAIDIKRVGRELGVRYVLEGSVRKSGQRVRVSAQLIEAETGNHIWAERYDRELADIFDLQDELTEAISAQVDAELAGSEREQAHRKATTDLNAWDLYQRGMWHFYKSSKDDMAEARRLLQLVSERAPEFANAYAGLAIIAVSEIARGFTQDKGVTLEQGLRDAQKAIALDDRDGYNHYALGLVCMILGDRDRAIPALERSIELNPSFASCYYGLGYTLCWFGRAEEAISLFDRAIRFSPHDPNQWAFHHMRSAAHSHIDEFDLALTDAKAAMQAKNDEFWPHLALARAYSSLGRNDEARAAYERACELKPELSTACIKSLIGTLHPPYLEKWLDALRQVGMPEQ